MDRRAFFRFLGIGAGVAIVAPKMLARDNGLHGEPVNMEPFRPKAPFECRFVFPSPGTYVVFTGDNPTCGPVKSYIWKNPASEK
jgi:hypothetical protein